VKAAREARKLVKAAWAAAEAAKEAAAADSKVAALYG